MYLDIQTHLFGEKKSALKCNYSSTIIFPLPHDKLHVVGALLLAAYWSGKEQNISTVPKIIKLFVDPYNYQYPDILWSIYTTRVDSWQLTIAIASYNTQGKIAYINGYMYFC